MTSTINVLDHDHTNVSVAGASSKEVRQFSDSEQPIVDGVQTALERAANIQKKWKAREQRDGEHVFHCPFCERGSRENFTSKKLCQTHIEKSHKHQVHLAKHEKRPPEFYSPIPTIIPPKRTLSDYLPTEGAVSSSRYSGNKSEHASHGTKGLRQRAAKIANKGVKASVLIGEPEGVAIPKLEGMEDAELKKLTQLATNRGRRRLNKACRKLCEQRGIEINF